MEAFNAASATMLMPLPWAVILTPMACGTGLPGARERVNAGAAWFFRAGGVGFDEESLVSVVTAIGEAVYGQCGASNRRPGNLQVC